MKKRSKKRYAWNRGSKFSADPQSVGEELARLQGNVRGKLTPEKVVTSARKKNSPLHSLFEWNDSVAGEKYRQEQARCVIRNIRVVYIDRPEPVPQRVYVHVSPAKRESAYYSKSVVMADDELRRQALHNAITLLQGIRDRYAELAELKGVFREIDKAANKYKDDEEGSAGVAAGM